MLSYLAVCIEVEDVDASVVVVAWPRLVAVQHDVFALRDGALEVKGLAGVLGYHPSGISVAGEVMKRVLENNPRDASISPSTLPMSPSQGSRYTRMLCPMTAIGWRFPIITS